MSTQQLKLRFKHIPYLIFHLPLKTPTSQQNQAYLTAFLFWQVVTKHNESLSAKLYYNTLDANITNITQRSFLAITQLQISVAKLHVKLHIKTTSHSEGYIFKLLFQDHKNLKKKSISASTTEENDTIYLTWDKF